MRLKDKMLLLGHVETFEVFIKDIRNISIEDYWITGDVRPGREEEQWLNLLLRKTNS